MTKAIRESVAKALVINEKHEVLVLTRSAYKERPEKSFAADLPGGVVDPGETALMAVQRELKEETGIEIEASLFKLAYAKTKFFAEEKKSVTKFLYTLQVEATPDVVLSWEHIEYKWVPVEGIVSNIKFGSFYEEAITYTLSNDLL